MIRAMPLISSATVIKSKVPAIAFETPKAIIKTPIKNIIDPK